MQTPARATKKNHIARRSSGALIADELRRQIIRGDLGPGERLTQEEIAAELGASRVPVREALIILEQEGWVAMEMHRGGRVLPIQTAVSDNAEIWELVFGLVARRAVARLTADVEEQLDSIAGRLAAAQSPSSILELNEHYLDSLFEAARAPAMARMVRRSRAVAIEAIIDLVPETTEIIRKEALAVIDAIRAHDDVGATAIQAAAQRECLDHLFSAFDKRVR